MGAWRSDLRVVDAASELDIELRLLVSRHQDLTADQTRRLARMHDLLVSIFPELEHAVTLTSKTTLSLLSRYVTPQEFRAAGSAGLAQHLGPLGKRRFASELIHTALGRSASPSSCQVKRWPLD